MRRGPLGGRDVAVTDRSPNDGGGAEGASSAATSRPLGRCTARWGPSCCACIGHDPGPPLMLLHARMMSHFEQSSLQNMRVGTKRAKLEVEVINANYASNGILHRHPASLLQIRGVLNRNGRVEEDCKSQPVHETQQVSQFCENARDSAGRGESCLRPLLLPAAEAGAM